MILVGREFFVPLISLVSAILDAHGKVYVGPVLILQLKFSC